MSALALAKLDRVRADLPEDLPQESWLQLLKQLCAAQEKLRWLIGDALVFGERYPNSYKLVAEATGYRYGDLRDIASVARRVSVSVRTDKLSWSHHRAVASLGQAEQTRWLDTAVKKDLSVPELRKEVRKARTVQRVAELPEGVFRVVYADPPWFYAAPHPDNYGPAERHYPTMTTDEICDMPLPKLADDAVLFLWATCPLLFEAPRVIAAWGFEYKAQFVWDKVKHNYGHYNSVRHELLLIATRGSCLPDSKELVDSVQSIERTEHSRKPEEFRRIIDRMYPHGRRVELFARGKLPKGWDGHGSEFEESMIEEAA